MNVNSEIKKSSKNIGVNSIYDINDLLEIFNFRDLAFSTNVKGILHQIDSKKYGESKILTSFKLIDNSTNKHLVDCETWSTISLKESYNYEIQNIIIKKDLPIKVIINEYTTLIEKDHYASKIDCFNLINLTTISLKSLEINTFNDINQDNEPSNIIIQSLLMNVALINNKYFNLTLKDNSNVSKNALCWSILTLNPLIKSNLIYFY